MWFNQFSHFDITFYSFFLFFIFNWIELSISIAMWYESSPSSFQLIHSVFFSSTSINSNWNWNFWNWDQLSHFNSFTHSNSQMLCLDLLCFDLFSTILILSWKNHVVVLDVVIVIPVIIIFVLFSCHFHSVLCSFMIECLHFLFQIWNEFFCVIKTVTQLFILIVNCVIHYALIKMLKAVPFIINIWSLDSFDLIQLNKFQFHNFSLRFSIWNCYLALLWFFIETTKNFITKKAKNYYFNWIESHHHKTIIQFTFITKMIYYYYYYYYYIIKFIL